MIYQFVQKDGIHGNQKLKITESCYTVQWRWKPDGGRHVNHTLKDGGVGGGGGGNMYVNFSYEERRWYTSIFLEDKLYYQH